MITANLNELELNRFDAENDPDQQCEATFPIFGALGARNSAMVYFELEAGKNLGRHTDSEEEILLILDGDVEVTVGDETGRISAGHIALVPKMVPHDIRNCGTARARVLGFFGSPNIVATFDNIWLPVHSNVVDTSHLIQPADVPAK